MAARAVVFDLDGTVWDSYPWVASVIGDGRPAAEAAALASLRDGGNVAKLLTQSGLTRARFRSICAAATDLRTYRGVRATLEALRDRDVPLGVVTNLPAWVAEPMLARVGIDWLFGSIVGWRRTHAHKPHPAPILASLDDLRIEPGSDVWYVGDSATDGEAAVRAGISFAWVSYGYGASPPDGTSAVIRRFRDVAKL